MRPYDGVGFCSVTSRPLKGNIAFCTFDWASWQAPSPAFAEPRQAAGIVFIGPRPETIALLGDKVLSDTTRKIELGVVLVQILKQ